jgi:hypothetical protein
MSRDRIALVALSFALALGVAVSCTDSEPVNRGNQTGAAGSSNTTGAAGSTSGAAGAANTTGAAGSTTGAAGSATGAAGSTTGAAGSATGAAGSTGAAGNTTGAAGSTGNAGSNGSAGSNGNAGSNGAGGTGVASLSFTTDIYPFIKTQCTPCHITNTDGQLSMKDAATAYTNLVGTTMGVAAKTNLNCTMLSAAKKRVVPGDPAHSFLYIKISQTDAQLTPGGCNPAMPEVASKLTLTADQQTKIHDWIMGGAQM